MLDGLEPAVARAFERALAPLAAAGAAIETIELPLLGEIASINASGGFAAAESWAWHRKLLAERGGDYDPRVATADPARRGHERGRLHRAASPRGATGSPAWKRRCGPTTPCSRRPCRSSRRAIAPLVAERRRLLRGQQPPAAQPSIVNLLDGCALSLPCHAEGELPVGLMLWGAAMRDDAVLDAALAVEAALALLRSAAPVAASVR